MSVAIKKFNFINEFDEFNAMPDNEDKNDLKDYCADIQSMVDQKIGVVFRNKGKLHAAVVMSNIFASSEKNIKIFAGDLNGDVSGVSIWRKSIIHSFENNPELKIEAVFENIPKFDSIGYTTLRELRDKFPERVELRKFNEISVGFFKENLFGEVFHFAIGDDNKYRIETNTSNYTAVCNFDNKGTSSKLNSLFNIIKVKSSVIP